MSARGNQIFPRVEFLRPFFFGNVFPSTPRNYVVESELCTWKFFSAVDAVIVISLKNIFSGNSIFSGRNSVIVSEKYDSRRGEFEFFGAN